MTRYKYSTKKDNLNKSLDNKPYNKLFSIWKST